jgi:DNA-binding NtrC family response regulator
MLVIRAVSDLVFSRKISEVCKTLQIESQVAKSLERLDELLKLEDSVLVIVDLALAHNLGVTLAERAVAARGAESVYCFYSHVAHEEATQAKAAGITNVSPRSSFFDNLGNLLSNKINQQIQAQ